MIGPSGAVRVMLATRPVGFRKGMDGLAALVRDAMGADPFSGTVYVFRSKRKRSLGGALRDKILDLDTVLSRRPVSALCLDLRSRPISS